MTALPAREPVREVDLGMMVELHSTRSRVVFSPWVGFWVGCELVLCALMATLGLGPQGMRYALHGARPYFAFQVSPRANRERAYDVGLWVPAEAGSEIWFRMTSEELRRAARRSLGHPTDHRPAVAAHPPGAPR